MQSPEGPGNSILAKVNTEEGGDDPSLASQPKLPKTAAALRERWEESVQATLGDGRVIQSSFRKVFDVDSDGDSDGS